MNRLQKVIASAGICSRRKAEVLIQEGRVTVNGTLVTRLGTKVDLGYDHVRVDGKRIRPSERRTYLLMNKPRRYLCTLSDPAGRPGVMDLIKSRPAGVYPVGRLDFNTEGLLLLTNDGEFANRIASAGPHCPKTYLAKVRGTPSPAILEEISGGLSWKGMKLAPCKVSFVRQADNSWLRITLVEGKKKSNQENV
jgi:pseudouridine synthase